MSDENGTKKKRRWRVSRRGFLIGLGTTGALAAGGVALGLPRIRLTVANTLDSAAPPFSIDAPPTSWFEILPDNTAKIFVPKVEMGQGIHTAIKQLAAEELEVAWDQLEVVLASSFAGPTDSGGTGASASVSGLYVPLREAAATMREMLRSEAANKMGVSADTLTITDGVITASNGESMTYGDVVTGVTEWEVPEEAPALKPRSQWRYVGKPMPRVDFEAKLTGQARYGYDMRLPNMLYGAVAQSPTIEGEFKSASEGRAPSSPGVVQVVIEDDWAGVVAETRPQADIGRNRLEVEWDEGKLWQQEELDALVTVGEGKPVVIQKEGDAESILKDNSSAIIAEYRSPMAAHAHLEPQAALVDVQDDIVTAFISTQFPNSARRDIAAAVGVDEEMVNVTATYLGGGFGRKLNTDIAVDAAKLSKAVGRPVHIGWNRREEFRNGFVRPATHHILKGVVDSNGRVEALEHQQASGDVAFPFFPAIAATVMGADFGAWRGSRSPYGIPNIRTVAWRTPMPIATGWWRGLGLLCNTFALESFMDELAYSANMDPLEFRLAQVPDTPTGARMRTVLERAAETARWGSALPEGHALGVAYSTDVGTPCAQVAEVSIEGDQIRVHKVACAIDPGTIINPDGVSAQTQGSIIMGLSSTFFEKLTVKDGRVEAGNFDRYPLITMKEAPEITVIPVESGDDPTGMGEPPIGPIAAAVGNAVYALTGQRLREMPLVLNQ